MPVAAQTWTGAGLTGLWSEALNWQGFTAPLAGPATAITFAGSSRLNAVQNLSALYDLNSLSFAANAGAFNLGGNALRFTGANARLQHNGANAVTIANNLRIADSLTYDGSGSATLTGTLGNGNANPAFRPTLTKRGSGRLTLSAETGFGGRVVIEQGSVRLTKDLALQSADVSINVADGLDLSQVSSASLGGLSGSGAVSLGATQLTVGGSGSSPAAYTGNLSATTGTLTKVGAGTLQLAGASALDALSVQAGGVVLDGGALTLDLGGEALVVGTQTAGASGGPSLTLRGGVQVAVTGPTVVVDGAGGTQLVVSGAGTRINTGFQALVGNGNQGRLEVGGGATFAAATYLIAGFGNSSRGQIDVTAGGSVFSSIALIGTLAGGQGTVTVGGNGASWQTATLGMGGLLADLRGGKGSLAVGPGGTFTVTDTLAFWTAESRITVDGGRLFTARLVDQADGRGSIELRRDPAGGAALTFTASGGTALYGGSLSGAGSVLKTGAGTQVLTGSNSFSGSVTVNGGTLEMITGAASEYTAAGSGVLRLAMPALGVSVLTAQPGGRIVYTAPVVSGGLLAGPGTHDLTAVTRLVGSGIANGATVSPAAGTTFVGVASADTVVNEAGRTLTWNQGSNTMGSLTVAGTTLVNGFGSAGVISVRPGATLQNAGADLLLGGGSRTSIGSAAAPGGTLRSLPGTQVQLSGGLLVNNGTFDGALVVNFGGLAKGAGSFGAVTINDGGRFSPGNSPGTAATGPATWGAGGTYVVELAAANGTAGVDWDLWAIDGVLDISAGSTANSQFTLSVVTIGPGDVPWPLAGFDPTREWRWTIARASGGVTGFDPSRLALDTSGFANTLGDGSFALALAGSELQLVFAPVPEPAGTLLFGLGALGLLAQRRLAARRDAEVSDAR